MKQTPNQFLPFHVPLIEEDDMAAVRQVMQSGWITMGPKTVEFEQKFARFIGTRHAVAVNSGTAALHLALEAIGLNEGDEVLLPTLTFAATAEAVVYCRAKPVLMDCEPDTFNIDPVQVESAITPRTRAIIPVHFAGHPCDMDRLLRIARKHNLWVIEDAAHALSARYRGRTVGTLGDMTCFSFYATKNITTGEGGMLTTERDEWADRARIMRLHGISKDAWKRYSAEGSWRYEIVAPGYKYNMTDMQAALGCSQLEKCQAMWARRSEIAERYSAALGSLDAYEIPMARTDVQHAWHLYVLRVCPGRLSIHRDRLIEELKSRGIGTSVHFIPLHLHPYYRDTWGYRPGDFPVAEDYFERCLSLPLYPAMTDEDQEKVIESLTEIAGLHRYANRPQLTFSRSAMELSAEPSSVNSYSAQSDCSGDREETAAVQGKQSLIPAVGGMRLPIPWYAWAGKRILDIVGAGAGLIVTAPLLAACAIAVRLSSPGPVVFRQRRVGRDGRVFHLLKFRTMMVSHKGPYITVAGDSRVTGIGRYLRRWKLDELLQLFNVFKGEMSLVGPRPEIPELVATYNNSQLRLLACRPGITSPASLVYIDEEEILAQKQNSEDFYREVVLPHKLDIDLAYCLNPSLMGDVKILLATARRMLPWRSRNGKHPMDDVTKLIAQSKASFRSSRPHASSSLPDTGRGKGAAVQATEISSGAPSICEVRSSI